MKTSSVMKTILRLSYSETGVEAQARPIPITVMLVVASVDAVEIVVKTVVKNACNGYYVSPVK